jgi:hypothetical protein
MVCAFLYCSRFRRVGVELFDGESVARVAECVNKQFERRAVWPMFAGVSNQFSALSITPEEINTNSGGVQFRV